MLYEALKGKYDDYGILRFAHVMLDSDEGLSEEQFMHLQEFVYDQVGATTEFQELFNLVDATDGRFYIKEEFGVLNACKTNQNVV